MVPEPDDAPQARSVRGGRNVDVDARRERSGGDLVYESLRQDIVRGTHPPGARLIEAQLAKAHGVSRTPVRAAIARLEGDGLVETITNRGAIVSTWTDNDFEEVYALRIRLEPYASRLAAGQVETEELDRLEDIATSMIHLLDEQPEGWTEQCTDLNWRFHSSVLRASRSPRLISMVISLTEVPMVRRSISLYPREALRRNFQQHHQMLMALRAGDGEWAEALMTGHILGARNTLRAHSLRTG
ncbi:GntR family transcriptional regulator [Streptomyces sp. NPDC059142]|uniref:GntR family transcriptional regulator n=1 Tax=Streptomyces sp. NPDC059142 TaxID=3346739 RepID=UPI0036849BCC